MNKKVVFEILGNTLSKNYNFCSENKVNFIGINTLRVCKNTS